MKNRKYNLLPYETIVSGNTIPDFGQFPGSSRKRNESGRIQAIAARRTWLSLSV